MKKVLLTGASSGIGKAIAEKLSKAGYNLICTVRKEEDKIALEYLNNNIECFYLDVTKDDEVKNLYYKLKSENVELVGTSIMQDMLQLELWKKQILKK